MKNLLQSSQFWTAVLDALTSIVIYLVGRYAVNDLDMVKFVIAALQPIFVAIIAALTVTQAMTIKYQAMYGSRNSTQITGN